MVLYLIKRVKKNFLLNELNNALKQYYNGNGQKGSYNCLFTPLQKANKFLTNEGIFIFPQLKKELGIPENKNPKKYLKNLSLKVMEARNIIWVDNLGLLGKIAEKYIPKFYNITFDEIESEGHDRILKSMLNYNSNLEVPFPNYTISSMTLSIINDISKYVKPIPFVNFHSNYNILKDSIKNFKEKFKHLPNDKELAEFMGKTTEYVKNMKFYKENLSNLMSLNESSFRDGGEELLDTIIDPYYSSLEDEIIEKITLQEIIENYIPKLPDEEKSVLLGQLENKTLADIAREKNCTRAWTSLLKIRGIEKIGALMEFKEIKKICRIK